MKPTKRDLSEFEQYVRQCSDTQLRNVYAKETLARRTSYARIAKTELERRGLTP